MGENSCKVQGLHLFFYYTFDINYKQNYRLPTKNLSHNAVTDWSTPV